MKLKINFTIIFVTISLGLLAQGKFYITPQVYAYVGSYREVASVNKNQAFIKSRNFTRKDFLVGEDLSYYSDPLTISLGIGQAEYSSGIRYEENKILFTKLTYSGLNIINYYLDFKMDKWAYNRKIPKRWRNESSKDKFLIVSKISPFIGVDFFRFNKNTLAENRTSISGNLNYIPGTVNFIPNSRNGFGIRAGVDWVFYNREKRKLVLTLMYKFGLSKLGTYKYRFQNQNRGIDFNYETTTNGSGFCIKAGFPIRLFEVKKK
jgi:hypothetical protein